MPSVASELPVQPLPPDLAGRYAGTAKPPAQPFGDFLDATADASPRPDRDSRPDARARADRADSTQANDQAA
ncbi:MAG TPA: hypothetical protein VG985_02095, partial [Xanthobacteraceae bacterium]|nr:hypothetical protein [Xanthobacteraceae bacterium]